MSERLFTIATGTDFLDPNTRQGTATAARFVERLRKSQLIDLTHAEYTALSAREKSTVKKGSFFLGGDFGGRKTKADCKSRSLITLDFDDLTPHTMEVARAVLQRLQVHCVIYSTASHTPQRPRLRAVIFLKEDVPPQKYPNIVQWFMNTMPPGAVSRESLKPGQIMYFGAHTKDTEPYFEEMPGVLFDGLGVPDQEPELSERPETSKKAWEVPGIVGRVAERYMGDLDRAIEELGLPYQRSAAGATCGEFEDRYSYTEGQGADGMVWYRDDGHAFSHHGSDPASQQNSTIFDLVRLHRFNPKADDETLPLSERASHKAAEKFFLERFPELAATHEASVDEMDIVPDDVKLPERPAQTGRFMGVSADAAEYREPLKWFIKGLLPRAELGVIYGASGTGKSFLAFDMAAAIARGIQMYREHRVKKARVAYFAAEAANGFWPRIEAYRKHNDASFGDSLMIVTRAPNLLLTADITDMIADLKAMSCPELVIIDTLAATTPGSNENESTGMGLAIAHCKRIHEETGAMVLLIHHSGKDAAKGSRGWSGLRAAADVEWEISRNDEIRVLSLTKSKDGVDGLAYAFRLGIVELNVDEDGDMETSCVIEPIDMPKPNEKPKLSTNGERFWECAEPLLKGAANQRMPTQDLLKAVIEKIGPDRNETGKDRTPQNVSRGRDNVLDKLMFLVDGHYCLSPIHTAEFED